VFLKYANWAKELGIVLTPRHITEYSAEVMNIGLHDIVLDPCCGTGGFLVASLDYVKKNFTDSQIDDFKRTSIFGIEQESSVASLAVVNMIFRGDGKNNIIEGNCFQKFLAATNTADGKRSAKFVESPVLNPPITKVLMNPPFALKKSSEKEYKFINHALKQMEDGGILFSVLPYSLMVKTGSYLSWRKQLLRYN
jgi:type I restriction enzyme M protein